MVGQTMINILSFLVGISKMILVSKEELVDINATYAIKTPRIPNGIRGKYEDLAEELNKPSKIKDCVFRPDTLIMLCDFWDATEIWKVS